MVQKTGHISTTTFTNVLKLCMRLPRIDRLRNRAKVIFTNLRPNLRFLLVLCVVFGDKCVYVQLVMHVTNDAMLNTK